MVGGGISGLTTAQAFAADHSDAVANFLITEARDRVGGNITTKSSKEGYLWEEGPNSFQPNDAMLKAAVSPNPTHYTQCRPSSRLASNFQQPGCFS